MDASDTPRTDATIKGPHSASELEQRLHSLCATLERELSAASRRVAELEENVRQWVKTCDAIGDSAG